MGLTTNFIGLKLKNSVFVASGIAGFGEEYSDLFDINKLGGFITKTVTLLPRKGNSLPRIVETTSGMINSIGLENPGVDAFIEDKLPFLRKNLKIPVIVSIGGETAEELVSVVRKLNGVEVISAIELNLSCPNIKSARKYFISQDKELAYKTIRAIRKVTKFPLIAKLSPAVTDITEIAQVSKNAGADAVALINSFPAMFFSKDRAPVFGGLSGPVIKPIALKMIYEVSRKVKIPVMGVGGITSVKDAMDFFAAGSSVIAVGSCMFKNPKLPIEIIKGLSKNGKQD